MSHHNYLAQRRQGWALSQRELANLLGVSQSTISRCERGIQHPCIALAMGCQLAFGKDAKKLFPDLYLEIEDAVMRRAARLDRAIRKEVGAPADRKRLFLAKLQERANPTPA